MDAAVDVERVADRLGALANPLRVRILLALAETRRPNWDHRGLSYSELRDAVSVEDGGRFNYHLDELRGEYVVGDDGHYWLTTTGIRVVDEIYAGTFGDAHDPREETVGTSCRHCDEQLTVRATDGIVVAECPTHGRVFSMPVSPGVPADRDLLAVYAWAGRRAHWYLESVRWDVCPHCGGSFGRATFHETTDGEVTSEGNQDEDGSDVDWSEARFDDAVADRIGDDDVLLGQTCARCGIAFLVPAEEFAMTTPASIAFGYDHGCETWTDALLGTDDSERGAELRDATVVTWFELDDERLEIELDRHLDVVSTERRELDEQS